MAVEALRQVATGVLCRSRWIVILVCIALILRRVGTVAGAGVATTQNAAVTLEFLVAGNEQARNRISTAEYTADTRLEAFELSGAGSIAQKLPVAMSASQAVVRKGDWISVVERGTDMFPDGHIDEHETRAVANDKYVGMWSPGTRNAQRFDHDSLKTIGRDGKEALHVAHNRDLLLFGFGNGVASARNLFGADPARNRWDVVDQKNPTDGTTSFQITKYRGKAKVSSYDIEPDKGFLITNLTVYHRDGSVSRTCEVDARQADASGIWYPAEVDEKWYHHSKLIRTYSAKITKFRANVPTDDRQFSMAGLDLPEGTYIFEHTLNGSVIDTVLRDGKLVPHTVDVQMTMAGAKDVWEGGTTRRHTVATAQPGAASPDPVLAEPGQATSPVWTAWVTPVWIAILVGVVGSACWYSARRRKRA